MRVLPKLPIYLLGALLALVFSCTEKPAQKTVSLDKIRPKSETKRTNMQTEKKSDTLRHWVNYYANDSASVQIAAVQKDTTQQIWFLDRFGKPSKRFLLTDSSANEFVVRTWEFRDSSACNEAFYNWLDQAGKNKSSVALNTGQVSSAKYQLFVVSEKHIFELQTTKAFDAKKWLSWLSGNEEFAKMRYQLIIKPKKKTIWLAIK